MDFEKRPIIIEGVNHSGTRLLVEILSILGSDGGDYHNTWNENKFFLDIHRELIKRISDVEWTETILNNDFIERYVDTAEFKEYITSRLNKELESNFPRYKTAPWHWKCPTSALFEKTWYEIFPDAIYLINQRDPGKIARSFLRRRGNSSLPFRDGLRFYRIMEDKIFSIRKKNEVIIDFDYLHQDVWKIVDIFPYKINDAKVEMALSKINYHNKLWSKRRKIRGNIKNIWASLIYYFYKKGWVKD